MAKQRITAVPFQPGVSGNPSGRRKGTGRALPGLPAIIEMTRQASPAAVQRLIDFATGKIECKAEASIRAIELVLDRAYGKVKGDKGGESAGRTQFVALLPVQAPSADDWAATFAPRTMIEHEPVPIEAEPVAAEQPSADND